MERLVVDGGNGPRGIEDGKLLLSLAMVPGRQLRRRGHGAVSLQRKMRELVRPQGQNCRRRGFRKRKERIFKRKKKGRGDVVSLTCGIRKAPVLAAYRCAWYTRH